MQRILIVIFSVFAVDAQINTNGLSSQSAFTQNPDFWLSTSVNVIGTSLFIARVHHPPSAKWFGYGTQLMGIPALTLSLRDISKGNTDFATWANMGYAAWALGATLVDHVFKVEYRDPVRPEILIPYVTGYYLAIGFQAAAQYKNGLTPWAIAGTACVINVAASFYARAKGAD